jgi:hypothetical protein
VPNTESLDFLIGKHELNATTGNFQDAWLLLKGEQEAGWTYTTLQDTPKKRIDFILFRGEKMHLEEVGTLDKPKGLDANFQPSDHRALWANFRV